MRTLIIIAILILLFAMVLISTAATPAYPCAAIYPPLPGCTPKFTPTPTVVPTPQPQPTACIALWPSVCKAKLRKG